MKDILRIVYFIEVKVEKLCVWNNKMFYVIVVISMVN